jgi:UDP-N-acetylmuramoylalanine--D-glutamate ligase
VAWASKDRSRPGDRSAAAPTGLILETSVYASPVSDLPSRVVVLGLARSGRASVAALAAQGVEIVAHDVDESADTRGLEATVRLGPWDDGLLDGVGLVVKSPGVPGHATPLVAARSLRIPVISEIELGARLLPNPMVGITTALLGAMLDAAGRPVEVAGNIGRPLTSLVGVVPGDVWIVCELSSFQLEDVETLRPRVAVLTNLEPDHIDRHSTFAAYAAAKLRVFENQLPDDVAVVPRGFDELPGAARRVEFAADDALPAEPRIRGVHNRENAAAATAAARAIGIPDEPIAQALETFPGVEHRIEEVGTLDGVLYVNDSKATNAAAALRALGSFPGRRLHVILGGLGKDEPYDALAAAFSPRDRAYLIGNAAGDLAGALGASDVSYALSETLEHAVDEAASNAVAGDVVLLSPACASFDQFEGYEQRGEEFRRLVQKLPGWGTDDVRTGARSSSDS